MKTNKVRSSVRWMLLVAVAGVLFISMSGVTSAQFQIINLPLYSGYTLTDLQNNTPSLVAYITAIVRATRSSPVLTLGASPRGSVALLKMAQAAALLDGRAYAVPDDVKELAPAVLRHRVAVAPELELEGITADTALPSELLEQLDHLKLHRIPGNAVFEGDRLLGDQVRHHLSKVVGIREPHDALDGARELGSGGCVESRGPSDLGAQEL